MVCSAVDPDRFGTVAVAPTWAAVRSTRSSRPRVSLPVHPAARVHPAVARPDRSRRSWSPTRRNRRRMPR